MNNMKNKSHENKTGGGHRPHVTYDALPIPIPHSTAPKKQIRKRGDLKASDALLCDLQRDCNTETIRERRPSKAPSIRGLASTLEPQLAHALQMKNERLSLSFPPSRRTLSPRLPPHFRRFAPGHRSTVLDQRAVFPPESTPTHHRA